MTDVHASSDDYVGPPRLPCPERLIMRRFSLFDHTTSPDLTFPDGVYCLAGANGLGKSTFLASLAYAVTGVVAEPDRTFLSAEDYFTKVKPYHRTYFRGRIGMEDSEAAEVELTMRVGGFRYRLVRGLFDTEALRELLVTTAADDDLVVDGETLDPGERYARYVDLILEHTGLDRFEQLVFLQHFAMLFDERRELLFWDETALSNALYLAFGLNPAMARQADALQEEIRKQDSLSRNYGWQASDVRKQLTTLLAAGEKAAEATEDEVDKLIDKEHRALTERHDQAAKLQERLAEQLSDAQLDISVRSSALRAVRAEYDALWSDRLQGHGHPSSHPLITTILSDERCSVCGTAGTAVVDRVRQAFDENRCPLCSSELDDDDDADNEASLERLQELDIEIARQQEEMVAAEQAVERLADELRNSRDAVAELVARLAAFEEQNAIALLRREGAPEGLAAVVAIYESQIAERLKRQEHARARRDRAKSNVGPLRKLLTQRYAVAQEQFVPRFERLAKEFLGLDLDVEFTAKAHKASLRLSVAGQRRREQITLSESQRFFVDIALRMALLEHIGEHQEVPPALLVDTPEGSLDIAYEAKAGSMFSAFATNGHRLIMTANINTSELLLRLAKECGPDRMALERMTEWATLSEVQQEEEGLFDRAYDKILEQLGSTRA